LGDKAGAKGYIRTGMMSSGKANRQISARKTKTPSKRAFPAASFKPKGLFSLRRIEASLICPPEPAFENNAKQ
jgi:hypothetical protein